MRRRSRWKVVLPLAMTLVAVSGCYSLRTAPVVPVPLSVASRTAFVLTAVAPLAGESGECRVLEAEGAVAEIRGDTVVFERITATRQPFGGPRCAITGRAYVVTSQHPDLRSQVYAPDGVGSAIGVILLAPVILVGVLVIFAMTSNGGW